MSKAKFERTKPHVNIGTIGHVDHAHPIALLSKQSDGPSTPDFQIIGVGSGENNI